MLWQIYISYTEFVTFAKLADHLSVLTISPPSQSVLLKFLSSVFTIFLSSQLVLTIFLLSKSVWIIFLPSYTVFVIFREAKTSNLEAFGRKFLAPPRFLAKSMLPHINSLEAP